MKGKIKCACACAFFLLTVACIVALIVVDRVIPYQKVSIANANLTRFELSSSPTTILLYNLTFTMSIHNSAVFDKIADYKDMTVNCYYNAESFDSLKLGDFKIKNWRTRLFNLSRSGNSTTNMGNNDIDAFKRSNETGFFDLEIMLNGKRILQSPEDGPYDQPLSYQCKLKLQLITSQNSSTPGNFQMVKCY